jgi:hypothetical protein
MDSPRLRMKEVTHLGCNLGQATWTVLDAVEEEERDRVPEFDDIYFEEILSPVCPNLEMRARVGDDTETIDVVSFIVESLDEHGGS